MIDASLSENATGDARPPQYTVWTHSTFGKSAQAMLEPLAKIVTNRITLSDEWYAEAAAYDAMIVGSTYMTGTVMDRVGPRLKVIARTGIGVDRVDLDAANERGIMVVNTPDGPTESTAEHAIALMLALTKGVGFSDRLMHAGQGFAPYGTLPLGLEAVGATLGLIGLGRIGSRVAQIGRVLGMRVLAYDPYISEERARLLEVELATSMQEVLTSAQVVSIHCPATPETYHLINAQTLALMQPGSYLVNVSRGSLIDEAALLEALRSGHLAGAGLDVYDPEPPAADNPLLTLPNTVCTSHIGSYTSAGVLRMQVMACEQVAMALRGERPTNLVNPTVWGKHRAVMNNE
jgi:D-3-phosphoglycerate dehydrogenase